eukprot:GHUV01033920.1.p1 GENE.GHUV01033920.1~~GHUV01033920.1.p1  ORF type:complete len:130 (+),score=30.06 GHUV01033920.1:186-575(+)
MHESRMQSSSQRCNPMAAHVCHLLYFIQVPGLDFYLHVIQLMLLYVRLSCSNSLTASTDNTSAVEQHASNHARDPAQVAHTTSNNHIRVPPLFSRQRLCYDRYLSTHVVLRLCAAVAQACLSIAAHSKQ